MPIIKALYRETASIFALLAVVIAFDLNAASTGEGGGKSQTIPTGQLLPNTSIIFDKAEGSLMNLTGKSKG